MGLSIVIPVYNEEECILPCLKQTCRTFAGSDFEVIVVNDGSTDRTHRLMLETLSHFPAVRYLYYSPNRGYSHAIRTGFATAAKDYVSFLDADLQYRPADLKRMYDRATRENLRFLIGLPQNKYYSVFRRWQSRAYNAYVSLLFGLKTADANSLKLMARADLRNINFTLNYGMIELETLIGFALMGYPIKTMPIKVCDRLAGASKSSLRLALRTLKDCLILRWRRHRLLKTSADPAIPLVEESLEEALAR
ncbi:MAG: glycosyltransferase family 2 protein [Patescibacteria group bacterium]